MRPTNEEIQVFLDAFDKLSEFEGVHRHIRNHGAFTEDQIIALQPSCIKVLEWLKQEILETP